MNEARLHRMLCKARRVDNNEWIIGYYYMSYSVRNGVRTDVHVIHCIEDDENYIININTLCQNTGLVDKNGKDIWENDKIRCVFFDREVHGVVYYAYGCFYISADVVSDNQLCMFDNWEVVGCAV